MPKRSKMLECNEEKKKVLEKTASSQTMEAHLVQRARIILKFI